MTQVQVVGPSDGQTTKDMAGIRADRYLIDSAASGGGFALVEQVIDARVLAAPLHRHSREDEYNFVLEGRMGVVLGDEEVFADAGTLVYMPRHQWHTYWNAGDTQLRVLAIIAPGGLEELFRKLAEPGGEYDEETLPALAAQYGCELDFAATMPIAERHQLIF
ncbi:cupin domain [Kribbella steppae]|uniref:Cupin domain n=1 Tax=Kribbella steppae TaxID=2512223 RepID=A0A4R2HK88_9ACTN|nr:cupin domain-containing protein [Kribbella steppae]TCO28185.1 cupin domain [Kribbella steppae]